jgi:hypothetical protein
MRKDLISMVSIVPLGAALHPDRGVCKAMIQQDSDRRNAAHLVFSSGRVDGVLLYLAHYRFHV